MLWNTNELVYLYFQKDEEALELLIEMFRPFARQCINKVFPYKVLTTQELDELYAEADMVLVECLHSYRIDQSVSFPVFWRQAFRNRLVDLQRLELRDQARGNGMVISLNQLIYEDGLTQLLDQFEDRKMNVHEQVLAKSDFAQMWEKLDELEWKPIEKRVIEWRLAGYNQREVADLCGRSTKYVRRIYMAFDDFAKLYLTQHHK